MLKETKIVIQVIGMNEKMEEERQMLDMKLEFKTYWEYIQAPRQFIILDTKKDRLLFMGDYFWLFDWNNISVISRCPTSIIKEIPNRKKETWYTYQDGDFIWQFVHDLRNKLYHFTITDISCQILK